MSEPITHVGIDAHKVELHVALLAPDASAPVTWKVQNEARAVERLRRKLEKAAPGPVDLQLTSVSSRRNGATARSTVRRLTSIDCSRSRSCRTTSASVLALTADQLLRPVT